MPDITMTHVLLAAIFAVVVLGLRGHSVEYDIDENRLSSSPPGHDPDQLTLTPQAAQANATGGMLNLLNKAFKQVDDITAERDIAQQKLDAAISEMVELKADNERKNKIIDLWINKLEEGSQNGNNDSGTE